MQGPAGGRGRRELAGARGRENAHGTNGGAKPAHGGLQGAATSATVTTRSRPIVSSKLGGCAGAGGSGGPADSVRLLGAESGMARPRAQRGARGRGRFGRLNDLAAPRTWGLAPGRGPRRNARAQASEGRKWAPGEPSRNHPGEITTLLDGWFSIEGDEGVKVTFPTGPGPFPTLRACGGFCGRTLLAVRCQHRCSC